MSFTWKRHAGNGTLAGSAGDGSTLALEQPDIHCYYSDVSVYFETNVIIPQQVGEYRWRSVWRRSQLPPPNGNPALEHKIVVSLSDEPNVGLVYEAFRRGGPEFSADPTVKSIDQADFVADVEVQNQLNDNTSEIMLLHGIQPQMNYRGQSLDFYEEGVAGIYQVMFYSFEGEDTVPLTYELAGSLDFRVFAVSNQSFTPWFFDPENNPGQLLTITADLKALSPFSWNPESSILYRILIQEMSSDGSPPVTIRTHDGTISPPHFPDASGRVAGIQWLWDGKNSAGNFVAGNHIIRINAITNVAGGNTLTIDGIICFVGEYPVEDDEEDRERRKLRDACGCETGGTTEYGDVQATSSLQSHFKGNSSMAINLTYQGVDSASLPSSLGYGWAINRTDRVGLNINDDFVYISKDGSYERWILGSDNQSNLLFIPAHSDNKIIPYLDNGGFIHLVYPDKSEKVFRPIDSTNLSGLILLQSDKNGNITYYFNDTNYGGRLWAISDDYDNGPSGRVTVIDYNGTALQPIRLRSGVVANGEFVSEQRVTQMLYHDVTDVANYAVEDRLAQVRRYLVTGAESVYETETYLYYADSLESHRFGKIYQILDARSNVAVEFDYYDEPQGRVATETVYGELERAYTYDDVNNSRTVVSTDLTGKSVPATRQTVTFYDKYKNVIRSEVTVGPDVNITTMEYQDPYDRYLMTRAVDPNLKTVERRYNERGNVIWSKDKDDNITQVEYYENDQDLVRQIKRPLVTVPDPSSPEGTSTRQYTTEFVYDERANLKKIIDPDLTGVPGALGRATHFVVRNGVDDHATDGQIAKFIDRRWDGIDLDTKDDYTTTFSYYPNGNLESIETPAGPGPHPARKVTFFYDNFDNVVRATDLLGNEWNARFDALDRPLEKEDARGVSTYMAYSEGLLALVGSPSNLGPDGIQSNAVGFPQQVRITEFDYDDSSRLRKVIRQDSSSTTQDRVEYEYNGFSELIKLGRMINGHNKTNEWTYDQLGRAIELRDTLGRLTTRAYEPFCIGFEETTARGITKTSGFDALCRPILFSSTSEEHVRTYDELGRVVAIEQKEQARYSEDNVAPPVVRRRFGSARYHTPEVVRGKIWNFEYDALDRVISAKYPEGEEMSYQYGHEGELLRVVDADEKATRYEYNNDLSLRKVVIERGGNSVAEFLYSYDAAGRMREIHYPSDSGIQVHFHDGGSPAISGWDENGQLTLMRYVKAREDAPGVFDLVRSFAYAYDDSGNRTSMVQSNGVPAEGVEWQYRYDWLDRLVQVRRGLGGVTPAVEREYVYDESDNRNYLDDFVKGKTFWYTYKTVVSGSETLYSDELAEIFVAPSAGERNPSNFVSQETFVIDDDGNMTSRTTSQGTTTYDWDDLNNLLAVKRQNDEVTQNLYDAGSIRKEKIRDNDERIKSFNSGMSSASEASTVANGNVSYLMGPQLMGFERNGNFFYFLSDVQGTVRDIVDGSGEVVQSYEFDEHGIPMQGSGAGQVASSRTYHGGLSVNDDIADSGLYMMGYRHYAAELGRFISRDPIGFSGGLNLFNGAGTNPVTFVDPNGLQSCSSGVVGATLETITTWAGEVTGIAGGLGGSTVGAGGTITGIGIFAGIAGVIGITGYEAAQSLEYAAIAEAEAIAAESRLLVKQAAMARSGNGFQRLSPQERSRIGKIGQCASSYAKDIKRCNGLTPQICAGMESLDGWNVTKQLAEIKAVCRAQAAVRFAACITRAEGRPSSYPPRFP